MTAVTLSSAPRRVTLLKKAYASISGERDTFPAVALSISVDQNIYDEIVFSPPDDDDINRLGEKVVLREQVKELFNKKYGRMQRRPESQALCSRPVGSHKPLLLASSSKNNNHANGWYFEIRRRSQFTWLTSEYHTGR